MGIALENQQNGALIASGDSVSLPQTTALGDCIVLALCSSGTAGMTPSGAGATWLEAVSETTGAPALYIWIGYNCSAGNTTFGVSYSGSSPTYVLGMFSGVATVGPLVTTTEANTNSSVKTVTSPSTPYAAGQLIVAAVGFDSPAALTWSGTTWSNGDATTSLGANAVDGKRVTEADFVLPSTGTATTATYTWSPAATSVNVATVVLAPAATGPSMTGSLNDSFTSLNGLLDLSLSGRT